EPSQLVSRDSPVFADYLNPESLDFFDLFRGGLDRLGIDYRLNPRLVRGLDYYTHTAFEFITTDLGAQGTVMGGGRYDGLVEMMGGPALPGVGWAAGIERLADRKSTRLNSSHLVISYAVFCLKKRKI